MSDLSVEKEGSLYIKFDGSCGRDSCQVGALRNGRMIFGTGKCDLDSGWEFPCEHCTCLWHRDHDYMFDLAVHLQSALATDKYNFSKPIYFTQEDVDDLEQASRRTLRFLRPFEKIIQNVIVVAGDILMTAEKMIHIAKRQRSRQLPR